MSGRGAGRSPSSIGARLFISCAQQTDSDEVKIAHDIADALGKMGFDPHIAIRNGGIIFHLMAQERKSSKF
jgi:hypothetical protein